jgi:GNAT superfamily N-acetyltransferase
MSLSRRALDNLPPALEGWRPVLKRARERIQIANGGDRGRIRTVIFYCAKMALGLEPLVQPASNEEASDPIELLRMLVPSYATPEGVTADDDSADNHWSDFLSLMERELDMDLRSLRDCRERQFLKSSDLGRLISKMQTLLETSSDSQIVLTIREFRSSSQGSFEDLVKLLHRRDLESHGPGRQSLAGPSPLEANLKRFVASSLGEAVGYIEGEVIPGAIRVRRLFVAPHMHGKGVSRRLIRRVVEEANETFQLGVWIERPDFLEDDLRKFRRAGFVPDGDLRLNYELKVQQKEKTLRPSPPR